MNPRFLTSIGAVCVLVACIAILQVTGCNRDSATASLGEVVIYSSIDEPYLTPLAKQFEQKTGIKVRVVTDTESTKSAALVERLEAERDRPQADVYWGNEIFHTIRLSRQGAFTPYRPATAGDVPAKWRGPGDLYTDIGLRVRMIAFSSRPEFAGKVSQIRGLSDLLDPEFKGTIGICHPGFGTASGHFAAMYVLWGESKYTQFLKALRANEVKLLGGNSAVVDQIAAGNLIAGLSDNDDVNNGKSEGQKIEAILPDQQADGMGTLLIPSTIALVNHSPHLENGKKLIDFLCDPAVEKELIAGRFFGYSVREAQKLKAMEVDYVKCAEQMKPAIEMALKILQDRQ